MNLFGRLGKPVDGEVAPAEALRRQADSALIVDVREPSEWSSGHAPGAKHIPLGQLSQRLGELPKERDVLFICQSGSRSSAATSLARQSGLTRAFNVTGGMSAWTRAGLPITRRD